MIHHPAWFLRNLNVGMSLPVMVSLRLWCAVVSKRDEKETIHIED